MRKKKKSIFKIIFMFFLIIITAFSVAAGYALTLSSKILAGEIPAKKVDLKKPVNILLLGVDAGGYENKKSNVPKRADTIMLIRYNPIDNKMYMLSIPRDTRVKINGQYEKINASHAIGGVSLAVKTIEKLLDLEINYYFKIDYEAFKKCIDAIGGVDVVISQDMNYDAYDIKIHFKKGELVHLDGEKAEKFIRWRKNNDGSGYAMGDLGRISTQQDFLINIIKKLKTPMGIIRIPILLDTLSKYVETNMDSRTMFKYLFKLKDFKISDIEREVLAGEPKYIGGISYYIFNLQESKKYLENFKDN